MKLPRFAFRQVDISPVELQELPGPEARPLRAKIMRQFSFLGLGGQAVLSPRTGVIRCRGSRPCADTPAFLCGNTIGPPAGILFQPMLFPRNALASGPQGCFFTEKKRTKAGKRNKSPRCRKLTFKPYSRIMKLFVPHQALRPRKRQSPQRVKPCGEKPICIPGEGIQEKRS
jgi:hypothetical protein